MDGAVAVLAHRFAVAGHRFVRPEAQLVRRHLQEGLEFPAGVPERLLRKLLELGRVLPAGVDEHGEGVVAPAGLAGAVQVAGEPQEEVKHGSDLRHIEACVIRFLSVNLLAIRWGTLALAGPLHGVGRGGVDRPSYDQTQSRHKCPLSSPSRQ